MLGSRRFSHSQTDLTSGYTPRGWEIMSDSPLETSLGADGCIAQAALFVASQPGAAARILTSHHRRGDGRCAGCGITPGSWPCVLVAIARLAHDQQDQGIDDGSPRHRRTRTGSLARPHDRPSRCRL